MTNDNEEIVQQVVARVNATRPQPFDRVPGGPTTAAIAVATVGFLAMRYFDQFQSSNEQLAAMQSDLKSLQQEVQYTNRELGTLKELTARRYTSDDAERDLNMLSKRIDANKKEIEDRGIWKLETDRAIQAISYRNEDLEKRLRAIENAD